MGRDGKGEMQAAFSGYQQQWVPAPGRDSKREMQATFSGCERQWGTRLCITTKATWGFPL